MAAEHLALNVWLALQALNRAGCDSIFLRQPVVSLSKKLSYPRRANGRTPNANIPIRSQVHRVPECPVSNEALSVSFYRRYIGV